METRNPVGIFIALMAVVLALPLASGCQFSRPLPMIADMPECRSIEVGPGPEDMVVDQWQPIPRILISCHERREPGRNGEIYFFEPSTGETGILTRVNEADRLVAFKPHGMDIIHTCLGTYLYVVLHDPRAQGERLQNAVGVYRVEGDTLRMVDLMEDRTCLWSPNDLSVLETGEIYLTNDIRGRLDMYLRRQVSEIAYYNPRDKTWRIVADGLAFANGILAESERVFVTTTLGSRVMAYPRNADGTLGKGEMIAELKGGDNLTRYRQYLLTTGHFDDFAFLRHAKDPLEKSPSVVMRIHPETGDKRAIYVDSGAAISAASTALINGNRLYISQVFDPFVLVCNVPLDMNW